MYARACPYALCAYMRTRNEFNTAVLAAPFPMLPCHRRTNGALFPAQKYHAARRHPLTRLSCGIHACWRVAQCSSCRSRRRVRALHRQPHVCVERKRARVRGGDEHKRQCKRQRGAQRNDHRLKLWRVNQPGFHHVHVQMVTKKH